MISFLFSIVDKKIFWDKVYQTLSQKYDDFEMVFAIKEQNPELEDLRALADGKDNIQIFEYEQNASENFMINKTIKHIKGDCLVLCRDYFVYATILSDFLIDMGKQGAQIAMFQKQKKSNKITKFFAKLSHKITRALFGFDFYDGDVGLVYFGNIALSVLKNLPNCSLLTKVNRWKGFEISYATTDSLDKAVMEKDETKKSLISLICSFVTLVSLVGALVLLCVFDVIGFLSILCFATAILVNVLWSIYSVIKFRLNRKVGNLKE